ncbi:hypothetical protein [Amaricoccus sp.]|uniref:hypothetical protein n=1 Tax=Amaricoccus sp. TaxID=1872485 RepID=UPI001B5F3009|nr:hypothetical protein [Amaricoccus sp.]MBP7000116.1 hypothetical protein [Amaricoccus sp.]
MTARRRPGAAIERMSGIMGPDRPGWTSLAAEPAADPDFLRERPELVEAGRFLSDDDSDDDERQ